MAPEKDGTLELYGEVGGDAPAGTTASANGIIAAPLMQRLPQHRELPLRDLPRRYRDLMRIRTRRAIGSQQHTQRVAIIKLKMADTFSQRNAQHRGAMAPAHLGGREND